MDRPAYLQGLKQDESSLITALQRVQNAFGYLPEEELEEIAKYINVPLSRIYGVATFYAHFRLSPIGKHLIQICHGTACHVTGSSELSHALESDLGIKEGGTTNDGLITIERIACVGCCSLAPTVTVDGKIYGRMTHGKLRKIVKQIKRG